MAEGVGFEPTDRLNTDQTISSRSRYDHFDSPPDITLYACLSDSICDYTECGAKNQGAEETFAEGWTIGVKTCTMAWCGKASLVQREVAERSEVGGIALPV